MPLSKTIFTREAREQAIDLLFSFDGRIGRSDYWISWPLWIIAGIALLLLSFLLAWVPVLGFVLWLIFALLALNSCIAVGRKRLHDRGKSGWWLLLFYLGPAVCDFVGQALGLRGVFDTASFGLTTWAIVELGVLPGTKGPNAYGPDPLDPQAQIAAQPTS